jgi:hypothetical protein
LSKTTTTSTSTGEMNMPYVNIKITKEGATDEQKKRLMAGVTNYWLMF